MTLDGTHVLVTGSTSGIGESIAEHFVRERADVVVTGRNAARGKAVAKRLGSAAPGRCVFIAADLATVDGPGALARAAEEKMGGIDVLVNNAGIYKIDGIPISAPEFDAMIHLNVRGVHLLTTALVPGMVERGSGVIVNITSPVAYRGYPGMAAYAGTKAALDMLTKCWAAEYGRSGIRVVALSPGPVVTPGVEEVIGAGVNVSKEVLARTGLVVDRMATGHDISSVVVFLARTNAAYIHGTTFHVDGGMNGVGSMWGADKHPPAE